MLAMALELAVSGLRVVAEDYLLVIPALIHYLGFYHGAFHVRCANLHLGTFRLQKDLIEFQNLAGRAFEFFHFYLIPDFHFMLLATGQKHGYFLAGHNFLKIPNPRTKIQPY